MRNPGSTEGSSKTHGLLRSAVSCANLGPKSLYCNALYCVSANGEGPEAIPTQSEYWKGVVKVVRFSHWKLRERRKPREPRDDILKTTPFQNTTNSSIRENQGFGGSKTGVPNGAFLPTKILAYCFFFLPLMFNHAYLFPKEFNCAQYASSCLSHAYFSRSFLNLWCMSFGKEILNMQVPPS